MTEKTGRWQRWRQGLGKMKEEVKNRFSQIWNQGKVDEREWEELEENLIQADLGPQLAMELTEEFRELKESSPDKDWKEWLFDKLYSLVKDNHSQWFSQADPQKLKVLLLLGINGVGKTTVAGKLAYAFSHQEERVSLIAADTFRAAAENQLEVWAKRVGVHCFRGSPGADPASVVFDGIERAKKQGESLVVVDTAGRSHANRNLLAELGKIGRVAAKNVPPEQIENILVVDALAGQNAFVQADSLSQVIPITGIILTKWDSQAKGGIIFRIRRELGLSVKGIGVGEGVEDLIPFDPEEFVRAVLS